MNLNQTFSIIFRLNYSKKNAKGLIPIWARITVDGRRAEFSTSKQVFQEQWNADRGEVHDDCPDAKSINDYLDNVKVEIKKLYNILLTTRDYVTAEDVKNKFKGVKERVVMFFEVFEQFNQVQLERRDSNDITDSRYKKWPVLLSDCIEFTKYKYKKTADL